MTVETTSLFPGHNYTRFPPRLFNCWSDNADLLTYFHDTTQQRTAECPAEYMAHFERAYVYEGKFLMSSDTTWFAPSIVDFCAADQFVPVLKDVVARGAAHMLPPSARPTVVIAKAGAENYGHTVAEIMPKVVNIWRSPLRDIRLILPEGMSAFVELLSILFGYLGIRAEFVHEPKASLVEVEDLYYFGPVSLHNIRKSNTINMFREILCNSLELRWQPRHRFFINRQHTDSRSLANSNEVEAQFLAKGYAIVYPGDLSIIQQIRMFSQASHIAGPLGAGLANTAFAPSECQVTMIDPGVGDYFFWDLASVLGQPFSWIFAGGLRRYTHEFAAARYMVNICGLNYALAAPAGP